MWNGLRGTGKMLLLAFFFLLLLSVRVYSQENVKGEIQDKLQILELRLLSCLKKIDNLKILISDLEKETQDYEQLSISYQKQLQEQTQTYNQLLEQYENLKNYLNRLETEKKWWKIGCIGAAGIAVVLGIILAIK